MFLTVLSISWLRGEFMIRLGWKKTFSWMGLSALLLTPLSLGGCGFQPLYGGKALSGKKVQDELRQVYVANIPSRFGQTIRLALQQNMAGSEEERPQGYVLKTTASVSYEAVDIHQDNTSGRTRVVGWANWQLYTVEDNPHLLAQGYARALDGYDPTINQYFAQTLNNETVQGRIASNLANQMTQQVAIWFKAHQSIGIDKRIKPGKYLDVDAMPTDTGAAKQHLDIDGIPASATGRTPVGSSTVTGSFDDDFNNNDEANP